MFKLFEHGESKNWEYAGEDLTAALANIAKRFDDFYWMDKDNCETLYIELWESTSTTITVYALNCGGWLGSNGESPYRSEYYGSLESMQGEMTSAYEKPTSLKPNKDYIIL